MQMIKRMTSALVHSPTANEATAAEQDQQRIAQLTHKHRERPRAVATRWPDLCQPRPRLVVRETVGRALHAPQHLVGRERRGRRQPSANSNPSPLTARGLHRAGPSPHRRTARPSRFGSLGTDAVCRVHPSGPVVHATRTAWSAIVPTRLRSEEPAPAPTLNRTDYEHMSPGDAQARRGSRTADYPQPARVTRSHHGL
jgi:hypothetical protein